jgi:hypothetical protein
MANIFFLKVIALREIRSGGGETLEGSGIFENFVLIRHAIFSYPFTADMVTQRSGK